MLTGCDGIRIREHAMANSTLEECFTSGVHRRLTRVLVHVYLSMALSPTHIVSYGTLYFVHDDLLPE